MWKRWTIGDQVAVLIKRVGRSHTCHNQVYLEVVGDDQELYYIPKAQTHLVRAGSICVLERMTNNLLDYNNAEWRVVTHELQKRD